MGPLLVPRASAAAPGPRPPQPPRPTWIKPEPAACTAGMATPAKAEAAANRLGLMRKSRREVEGWIGSLISESSAASENVSTQMTAVHFPGRTLILPPCAAGCFPHPACGERERERGSYVAG